MSLYQAVRPLLFRFGGGDPETAHEWTLKCLERLSAWPGLVQALQRRYGVPEAARVVFGLRFPSPVGLAAGMDKDARALPAWRGLGFGFVEVGTVTRHPQPGNPKPRLFRLPASEAIINRMGFNNQGAAALATRLSALGPMPFPVGISLGKSKITPLDAAVDDYLASLRILYRYGDYFAVNVSSPNTPGLRGLQDQTRLTELLGALQAEARVLAGVDLPKPLLVKLAPDLDEAGIAGVLEVCERHRIAGVIATNTTTGRYGLASADAVMANETGGLSGRPLNARACEVVRFIGTETGGRLPVVGVGGILDVADALRLFDAGASLVQLYTGLVYRGPDLVRRIGLAVAPTGHGHPRVNGSGRWGGSG